MESGSLSVILCVRNGMPLLARQLEALSRQKWGGVWEVIVVNNGCTDGSVAAVESAIAARVVDARTASGLAAARNIGARASTSEYLLFCDADDEVTPDWIDSAVATFGASSFFGGCLRVDRINDVASRWARPEPTPGRLPDALGFLPFAMGANFGVRRDWYWRVGGFDERFTACGDDIDFSWRMARAGMPPSWAPDVVIDYRLRSPGMAAWRQQYSYGKVGAVLYKAHRGRGCPRPDARAVARDWRLLATHPHLPLRRDEIGATARQLLATRLGHLAGAARQRVFFY